MNLRNSKVPIALIAPILCSFFIIQLLNLL